MQEEPPLLLRGWGHMHTQVGTCICMQLCTQVLLWSPAYMSAGGLFGRLC